MKPWSWEERQNVSWFFMKSGATRSIREWRGIEVGRREKKSEVVVVAVAQVVKPLKRGTRMSTYSTLYWKWEPLFALSLTWLDMTRLHCFHSPASLTGAKKCCSQLVDEFFFLFLSPTTFSSCDDDEDHVDNPNSDDAIGKSCDDDDNDSCSSLAWNFTTCSFSLFLLLTFFLSGNFHSFTHSCMSSIRASVWREQRE